MCEHSWLTLNAVSFVLFQQAPKASHSCLFGASFSTGHLENTPQMSGSFLLVSATNYYKYLFLFKNHIFLYTLTISSV
jgi:hypothetical protein